MRTLIQARLAIRTAVTLATAAMLSVAHGAEPTYPPNWQPKPAFPGQTRAPAPARASPALEVTTLASGLTGAWSMAFLPNGHLLVTQNQGTLRIVDPAKEWMSPFLKGVPVVKQIGANGMHDVQLDPDFASNRTLYITYFAPEDGEPGGSFPLHELYEDVWSVPLAVRRTMKIGIEKLARARLSEDETELTDVKVIGTGTERRIVLARDGTLWGIGADRFWRYESKLDGMEHDFADDPDVRRNFSGRVIRINKDGSIPKDNPWLSRATVDAQTYAHGFKDQEGAAMNPATGELWTVDHGPQGGDEVNIVRAGKDYGWPNVSYGTQYDARQADGRKLVRVGNGKQSMPGVEEPIYYWYPSIAPSGMMFYTADLVPQWKGNLFVGAMSAEHGMFLVRLILEGNRVVGEEHLLTDPKRRFRDIHQGPDGALYAIASDAILRIAPRK
jgi:glucose/arabinose dehydrogenase